MAKSKPDCIPCNRPKEKINMRDLKPKEVVEKSDDQLVKEYNQKYNQNLEVSQLTESMRKVLKNKLLYLLLIFTFISCSPDEIAKNNQDCNCGEIVEASFFNTIDQDFTVFKVKNYCTGEIKQIQKNGQYKKGDKYCGNN